MSYKVGDKVLLDGEVAKVNNDNEDYPYIIKTANVQLVFAESEIISKTYSDGLTDAWELARKITDISTTKERADIFGYYCNGITITDVLRDFTPREALAKIEAYEESKKEIKAGDFCVDEDGLEWLVTYVNKGTSKDDVDYHCMDKKGYTSPVLYHKGELTKTGRHIDIGRILEEIRG